MAVEESLIVGVELHWIVDEATSSVAVDFWIRFCFVSERILFSACMQWGILHAITPLNYLFVRYY